jgi:hypothetical protein
MSSEDIQSPPGLLRAAIHAVPAVKYALGIGGIIAVIAIVSSFGIGFRVAFFGTIVMLALMAVLVIFARLAGQESSSFQAPALVFTWFSLILFMAVAVVLFTSVFWGKPVDLRNLLGVKAAEIKIEPQPPPAAVTTSDAGSKMETPPKPSGAQSSVIPTPARLEKESPKTAPKGEIPVPTAEQLQDAQNEAKARSLEVFGDDAAERAISYMYCGLQGCNNRPPNQADINEARRLWAYSVSQWNLAYNTTHDPAYSDRLREKIRPESGLTCDDHSCEPNFTHENRGLGIHIPVNQFDPQ